MVSFVTFTEQHTYIYIANDDAYLPFFFFLSFSPSLFLSLSLSVCVDLTKGFLWHVKNWNCTFFYISLFFQYIYSKKKSWRSDILCEAVTWWNKITVKFERKYVNAKLAIISLKNDSRARHKISSRNNREN